MDVTPLSWRKSSYSSSQANCVEIAHTPTGIAVRDSKNPDGPVLHFPKITWAALVR
ncbi:DUF397 domain-containing protein [Saccharothrix coeruleofusca]|uniref:DUF397 domain-containing protein n=1 Tax=Saccharothrix coeruleofusca TaxID=33919 RepID=A0A918AQJ3_9PSEU|nr:DUF397 domain-containing protein [Saccharothrix coeruleofusca]MBP2339196.1 hypothetical protein [Saccharothrix coeruleofusca]GGP70609.1 hypothetical protein GCM10010185_49630 [Saccharothrix coeruleofusca]